jgi:hypothetical protein
MNLWQQIEHHKLIAQFLHFMLHSKYLLTKSSTSTCHIMGNTDRGFRWIEIWNHWFKFPSMPRMPIRIFHHSL